MANSQLSMRLGEETTSRPRDRQAWRASRPALRGLGVVLESALAYDGFPRLLNQVAASQNDRPRIAQRLLGREQLEAYLVHQVTVSKHHGLPAPDPVAADGALLLPHLLLQRDTLRDRISGNSAQSIGPKSHHPGSGSAGSSG